MQGCIWNYNFGNSILLIISFVYNKRILKKGEKLNQSLILSTQEGFDINKGKIQEEDTQVVVSRVIPFAFLANSKLSGELKSSKVLRIILP